MQNTNRKWQITCFGIAVVIAMIMVLLCTQKPSGQANETVASPAPFGANNYNEMKTDTFVALLHKAYGSLIKDSIAGKKLIITLKANELTKDFFNGNDAVLKFGLSDYGFDIKYNAEDKSMKAIFDIQPQNGVNVPNDVLIKLMDKTNAIPHVDQQK